MVKTEKNKLLRTGFEPGSRYPRFFSHSAICELYLFASISHVILILLLNLNSLNRYSNIVSSALINGQYLFNHVHVFHLTKISIVVKLYLYQEKKTIL